MEADTDDPGGQPDSAEPQRGDRQEIRRRAQAFDALPCPAVVLDASGTIVETNASWRLFARLNDATTKSTGVGVNYLDVCDRSVGSEAAQTVAIHLREILSGRRQLFTIEYPCPSASEDRWFQLQASAAPVDHGSGIVVLHLNITARRLLEESLVAQAARDPLTGLPNRRAALRFIEAKLEEAVASGVGVRVLALDLDGFKSVNDNLGHPAGDEVLIQATARARRTVRTGDLLCRMGGDEFVLVCPGLSEPAAHAAAGRLAQVITAPFQIGSRSVSLGVSIGIAVSVPTSTVASLLADADQAMYREKRTRDDVGAQEFE